MSYDGDVYGGVYRCNTVDTGFRSVGMSWKEGSATVRMAHRGRRGVRLVPARSGRRGVLRGVFTITCLTVSL